ncbi:MAG: glycoside hydrolase, partial [Oscillospiraceae bacterium]|nr:glycoside hydrolase [Oscillospiraceae bacterium]
IKYPVVFDWETIGGEDARTDDISVEDLDRMAALFCNSMAEHGYIPMVYLSKIQGMFKYDLDTLAGFDMWLAEYRDRPSFPYMFTVWQYASDGHVDGIEGTVDMDISFVDYSKERR